MFDARFDGVKVSSNSPGVVFANILCRCGKADATRLYGFLSIGDKLAGTFQTLKLGMLGKPTVIDFHPQIVISDP